MLSAVITIIILTSFANCYASQPYLIEYSWGSHSTPIEAVAHKAYIETLPFDGMMLHVPYISSYLMNTNFNIGGRKGREGIQDGEWTYAQCLSNLSPISVERPNSYYFTKLSHNFVKVYFQINAGLFSDSDWSWIIASFANLAKACKDTGLAGIVIDNEIYSDSNPPYFDYPNPLYYAGKTKQEAHLQSRLRGKQVMEAIISQFPNAAVLVMHGPYTSCWVSNAADNSNKAPNPPSLVNHCLGIYCIDERLQGSFAAGIVEGSALQTTSPHSIGIDGGELYDFHDLATFKENYEWRKYGILDKAIGKTIFPNYPVLFLDDSLRSIWSKNISISYALYDLTRSYNPTTREWGKWTSQTNMNAVRADVANAMRLADDYVWHYTEDFDWFADPANPEGKTPATKEWINAIRQGMLDAKIDKVAPTISITAPTSKATYSSNARTINLSGTAADNYYVKSVVWSKNGGRSGKCTLGVGSTWSASNIPLTKGTNNITVTVTDRKGNTTKDTIKIITSAKTPAK